MIHVILPVFIGIVIVEAFYAINGARHERWATMGNEFIELAANRLAANRLAANRLAANRLAANRLAA
jgi:hypothetical protein